MAKKLALRGHSTRGDEVIKLLEMMGVSNIHNLSSCNDYAYYVNYCHQNIIRGGEYIFGDENMQLFTLEEFLEKYPFKVGDKVYTKSNAEGTIINMFWNGIEVLYQLSSECVNALGYFHRNELKLYKEKVNMKDNKCTQCVYAVDNNHCGLRGFRSNFNVDYCSAQNVDKLPNGFELQEDGYFSWVNKKPKYPTSYEECCKITEDVADASLTCFACKLLNDFQKLLLCRDAYWEIAGEQMGLGKPWEPDWTNLDQLKYCIWVDVGEFITMTYVRGQHILAFPTEEMRDAFYENFKDLIEKCKELL